MIRFAIAGLLMTTAAHATSANYAENALKLCAVINSTGLLSAKCEVSVWNSSVSFSIDTTAAEARSMCAGLKPFAQKHNLTFGPGWSVKIFSPYSGKNTIAFCPLS